MLFSVLTLTASGQINASEQHVQEARAIVKTFSENLKAVLKPAMQSGGPVEAIKVCHQQAGPIASAVSSQSDWEVGRTSLKTRSDANKPDQWENSVLQAFEGRKSAGEPVQVIEYSEVVEVDGKKVFRYMKAIPTADMCLACHGEAIDQAVKARLSELYPNDQATGFRSGDIRGAFSLEVAF
jgi:hypothetical protein